MSISPDAARKIGQIQWPSLLPGEASGDFVTVSADYIDKSTFMNSVTAEAKRVLVGKVLIFVHGFSNKFDDAVYRFAQTVDDSGAPSVPVLLHGRREARSSWGHIPTTVRAPIIRGMRLRILSVPWGPSGSPNRALVGRALMWVNLRGVSN